MKLVQKDQLEENAVEENVAGEEAFTVEAEVLINEDYLLEVGDQFEIIKEEAIEEEVLDEEVLEEAERSVGDAIKAMGGNFGGDNESQMAGVQILKFLATSDDPKANTFMKALDKATTKISKDMS